MTDEVMLELNAFTTDALESMAGAHFMFRDDCPPMLRSVIRERQAIAGEIMKSRLIPPTIASADTACL